jgi:hypothetical protein
MLIVQNAFTGKCGKLLSKRHESEDMEAFCMGEGHIHAAFSSV